MAKHPKYIKGYTSNTEIAYDLSRLRYDSLSEIIHDLSFILRGDSTWDHMHGRKKLSKKLTEASLKLAEAATDLENLGKFANHI